VLTGKNIHTTGLGVNYADADGIVLMNGLELIMGKVKSLRLS
jgi:hypothetical protein